MFWELSTIGANDIAVCTNRMDDSIQFAQYAQIFQNDKDISYFAIKSVVSGMHNIYGWANNTILPAIRLVDCFYKKKM